ncbi:MAG: hypothetical protein HY343_11095 [Lentisphaerae bacterium]|nr:hypothetical protein [Lentisphaerota bacterium]
MNAVLALVVFLVVATRAGAHDIGVAGGVVTDTHSGDRAFGYQLEYLEPFGETFALSLAYLNEGHFPDHHRDGVASQLRVSRGTRDRRFGLSAGLGPYAYCDTASDETVPYRNVHGIGAMTSLATTFSPGSRVRLQLRGNWIVAGEMNTASLLLGGEYRFGPADPAAPLPPLTVRSGATRHNEITVLSGVTIVNSFKSEESTPLTVEYRRHVWRHVEWTLAGLDEGRNSKIDRSGPVSELWVVRDLFDDRWTLGLGAGGYVADDRHADAPHDGYFFNGIVSATVGFRFHPRWIARGMFHRVLTDYDRDTDVFLLGLGHLF